MECSCGGSTREARAERSKEGVVLEYQTCAACGRNEYRRLLVRGHVAATGSDAQRAFLAMEDGAPPPAPRTAKQEGDAWRPAVQKPLGSGLVRVRFTSGGEYIERPSFFEDRWDLVAAWQPYDNGPALAASFERKPIPPELRVDTLATEPVRAPRPVPTPPPRQTLDSVPLGTTLSLF